MRRRYAALLAGALSAAALLVLFSLRTYPATDFGIFYCAGQAANAHADPYRIEPLRTCERSVWPKGYLRGFAEPAALPGYALPPFMALAKLPFAAAKIVWLLALCASFGAAVAALTLLCGLNPLAVCALCLPIAGVLDARVGQLGPILLAGIALAALLLRHGHPRWAAAAALTAAIEPHSALPVLAALALLVPGSRAVIGAGIALFAALHFWILGRAEALEYFRVLLPGLARAEALSSDQYGSAWALHAAGLSVSTALQAAEGLYAAIVAAALAAAARARAAWNDDAAIVALPAAAAILATPFLHDVEICAALVFPLCALYAARGRALWALAAILLAVPWYSSLDDRVLGAVSVFAVAVFAAFAFPQILWRRALAGCAAALACAAAIWLLRMLPLHPGAATVPALLAGSAPSPQSWGAFLRAHGDLIASGPRVFVPKLLAWGAAALCLVLPAAPANEPAQLPVRLRRYRRANASQRI